jgi:hypothetical protein
VLFIDDREAVARDGLSVQFSSADIDWRLLHPEEVEQEDVDRADLVIVDYFLDDWPERDEVLSSSRSPIDGLAVAAALRSTQLPKLNERTTTTRPPRPVAFALWSANLDQAAFELPQYVLPHVFSRENNLEWVFRRNDLLTPEGVQQVATLAEAVVFLSSLEWLDLEPAEVLSRMLDLDASNLWSSIALEDALACRPPVNELGPRTWGLSVLRWLLHRVLPYPCFLMSEVEIAARLRVERLWTDTDSSPLFASLRPVEYTGVLAGFSGRLWWRAGVEDWIWQQLGNDASSTQNVADLAKTLGAQTERVWRQPVQLVDENLRRLPQLAEIADTVRIRPDDWPVYADDAYADRETVRRSPDLLEIVDPADRSFVEQGL